MRTHTNEPVVFHRDCKAVVIPAGANVTLRAGQAGYITQALGGSFTVYVEGNLFRIAGEDADAIGKEVSKPLELPPDATEDDIRELVWKQMRACYDPEIPINIVDLGLIYECDITRAEDGSRDAHIQMTLTAPGCGMGDVLVQDVQEKVKMVPTIREAKVDLVFDPPWNPGMMSEAARLQTGML